MMAGDDLLRAIPLAQKVRVDFANLFLRQAGSRGSLHHNDMHKTELAAAAGYGLAVAKRVLNHRTPYSLAAVSPRSVVECFTETLGREKGRDCGFFSWFSDLRKLCLHVGALVVVVVVGFLGLLLRWSRAFWGRDWTTYWVRIEAMIGFT